MNAYDVWVDMENPNLGLTASDVVTLRNKTTALTEEQKKARREVLQKTMKGKQ